ncbi:MAG: hypothetical protein ACOY90_14670 [Candidatus Zhuqueibacterota bacterium]
MPARQDLSRWVDSNFLSGMVACHIIDMSDARRMSKALVKWAYQFVRDLKSFNRDSEAYK